MNYIHSMKTYIIHVSDAYDREKHILSQLENKGLDVEFINEGDKKDITPEIIAKYFKGRTGEVSNVTSCAYKHILAYERFLETDELHALILEDDIFLYSNFNKIQNKVIDEIKSKYIDNCFISLEDSNLKFVKGSERKKQKHLYPKKHGRMAGAYIIDRECARSILNEIKENKCFLPIDLYHNYCSEKEAISIYWCHPAIAKQGSLCGKTESLLPSKQENTISATKYSVMKQYKKLIYSFR